MKTSKFIQLLSTLDKRTVNKFDKFLQSDYHDTEPKTRELWKYILPLYPDFEIEKALKIRAAKVIYGDEKQTKRITDRLAELSKVMQDFLMLEQLKKDDTAQAFLMLDVLKSKGLTNYTGLQMNHIERVLNRQNQRNMTYYYRQFRLAHERYYTDDTANKKVKSKVYLEQTLTSLDEFYCLAQLRHICEAYNRERVYNEDFNIDTKKLATLKEQAKQLDTPLADIYCLTIDLTVMANNDVYAMLKDKVLEYYDTGSLREQGVLMTFLCNYQIRRNLAGHMDALSELLDLYRFGSDNDIFTEGPYWSIQHFMNVVFTACEVGEVDWAADFVYKNLNKLPVKSTQGIPYRKKFKYLANSCIHLAKGNYSRAVSQAQLVRPATEAFMNLQSWTVEIRAHYELRHNTAEIYEKLSSFSCFLKTNRKAISDKTYAPNMRFIELLKKMLRAENKDTYTKEDLVHQLEWEERVIVCKRWLIDKVNALKVR